MNSNANRHQAYPAWAPRFWHGMLISDWLKLLAQNRFRIHPARLGLAFTVTSVTLFNSTMRLFHQAFFSRHVSEAQIPDDPVFIVGHWRSGTTYLHELLSCDDRFTTPTTYQCFAANHFLVTEQVVPRLFWFLMPKQRPMDNVRVGWDAPQEDEFALCAMGVPSPYLRMAFPNEPNEYLQYLDLLEVSPKDLEQWKRCLTRFLMGLTYDSGKRLILKSPTHTARIGLLAEMFPKAKFIHIVRHPLSLYPSTIKLWRVLDEAQSLQRPHFRDLKPYVFRAFRRMYDAFEQQRQQLADNQITDIRYEDLVQDPVSVMERTYAHLELGEFDTVREKLETYARGQRSYQTNKYDLTNEYRDEILEHWGHYAHRYGYLDPA